MAKTKEEKKAERELKEKEAEIKSEKKVSGYQFLIFKVYQYTCLLTFAVTQLLTL